MFACCSRTPDAARVSDCAFLSLCVKANLLFFCKTLPPASLSLQHYTDRKSILEGEKIRVASLPLDQPPSLVTYEAPANQITLNWI